MPERDGDVSVELPEPVPTVPVDVVDEAIDVVEAPTDALLGEPLSLPETDNEKQPTLNEGLRAAEFDISLTDTARAVDVPGAAAKVNVLRVADSVEVQTSTRASSPAVSASPGDTHPLETPVDEGDLRLDVLGAEELDAGGFVGVGLQLLGTDSAFDDGSVVEFEFDYSSIAERHGGNFAGRLQIVEFAGCWVGRETSAMCPEPTVVSEVDHDPSGQSVRFTVDLAESQSRLAERQADLLWATDDAARAGTSVTSPAQSGPWSFPTDAPMPLERPEESLLSSSQPRVGYALRAGVSSSTGDFGATDLNPSGSWSVGRQAGDFSYAYPVAVPSAPNGFEPQVGVSYNSGSIDGLTADQNTQGGLLGPGWSMGDAFIERRFKPCSADGGALADLCFVDWNATLSMAGVSGELVKVRSAAEPAISGWRIDHYRVSGATGVLVKHFIQPGLANARGAYGVDNDREHFQVLMPDGVAYWFGYGNRSGAYSPGTSLASVWTVPVVGNHRGEPCYGAPDRWCHQAYRWNLDRVVSSTGQLMNYRYTMEQNWYGTLSRPAAPQPYVSGGRLASIEYGVTVGNATSSSNTHRVDFHYYWRCKQLNRSCGAPTRSGGATNYPDIPTDKICTSGYCSSYSPTFFHRTVLRGVSTMARSSGPTFVPVQHVKFATEFVTAGGNRGLVPARVWLRSLHVANYHYAYGWGGSWLSSVRFDSGTQGPLPNRVDYDYSKGISEMRHFRVGRIRDEMGSLIEVEYGQPLRCPANVLNDARWRGFNNNTWSCFARWSSPRSGQAGFAIWHKWVVTKVTRHDLSGVNPAVVTRYTYPLNADNPGVPGSFTNGGMAWAYDNDRYARNKAWSQYRGFHEVRETVGVGADATTTVFQFYRGMHGDKAAPNSSATKSVTVSTSIETQVDNEAFRGLLMDRAVVPSTSAQPTRGADYSGTTTRYSVLRTFGSEPKATWVEPILELHRGNGLHSRVGYTYDSMQRLSTKSEWGRTSSSYYDLADLNGEDDGRCTKYLYTRPSTWFTRGLQSRTLLYSKHTCTGRLLSDESQYFDGELAATARATTQTPTRGLKTARVRITGPGVVSDHHQSRGWLTDHYQYESTGFDTAPGFARLTQHINPRGHHTTTRYTSHATNAPLTTTNAVHSIAKVAATNALGHTTTAEFDTYGNQTASTDADGRRTEACYDRHGRLTHVYGPADHKPSSHYSGSCSHLNASLMYGYHAFRVTNPAGPVVPSDATNVWRWGLYTVNKFDTNQHTHKWELLDGLARPYQTKEFSPRGGIIMTRLRYDSAGRTTRRSEPFHVSAAMGGDLHSVADNAVPTDHLTMFDSAGRETLREVRHLGSLLRRQTVSYDRVYTTVSAWHRGTNPYGATRTRIDAYGRVDQQIDDAGRTNAATTFWYTKRGELRQVLKPGAGQAAVMTYNMVGWQTRVNDPDAGIRDTVFYMNGEPAKTTDAANNAVFSRIDQLGRVTTRYRGVGTFAQSAVNTNRLQQFVYDRRGSVMSRGQLLESLSFQPAGVPAHREMVVALDAAGRPSSTATATYAGDDPLISLDHRLNDTFVQHYTYTTSGAPKTVTHPALTSALPAETVTYSYATNTREHGKLKRVSGAGNYITGVDYDALGRVDITRTGGGAHNTHVQNRYRTSDGQRDAILARTTHNGQLGGFLSTQVMVYNPAGQVTAIRENPADASLRETECFYYDSRQRLIRGLTLGHHNASCPTSPSDSTSSSGAAPYNKAFAYDMENKMLRNGGRSYHYGGRTLGEQCATGTRTPKPAAIALVTRGSEPAERFWYDCNGSVSTRVSGNTLTAYAFDELNQLEAVATGTTVTWANKTNVSVDPRSNDLTANTLPGTSYTAGASSTQTLDGNGSMSFRVRAKNRRSVVGLNQNDNNTSYQEIDYAIHITNGGAVYVYENGTQRPNSTTQRWFFNTVEPTDIFTIKRAGTQISYLRNGKPFYNSTTPANGTYRADTALIYTGTTIGDVVISNDTTTGVTRNVYDAQGQRVLRVEPNGTKTLYLDNNELRWKPGNTTITAARTYPGGTRHGFDGTLTHTITDHQNSPQTTLNTTTGHANYVRQTPYGQLRHGTRVDDQGFLSKTHDTTTDLTHLNARYYDPKLANFISVDPLVTKTNQPYTYATANPILLSDPSGLEPCPISGCTVGDHGRDPGRGGRGDVPPSPPPAPPSTCHLHGFPAPCAPPPPNPPVGVPRWVPPSLHTHVSSNPKLQSEVRRLYHVQRMSLAGFKEWWARATRDEQDWTNDTCSDFGAVTQQHFGCVRHDYLYRNLRRVDAQFGLEGALRGSREYRAIADKVLGRDVGGVRGWLVEIGVAQLGGAMHTTPWKKQTGLDDADDPIFGDHRMVTKPDGTRPITMNPMVLARW